MSIGLARGARWSAAMAVMLLLSLPGGGARSEPSTSSASVVTGRVLSPDGGPLPGAVVAWVGWSGREATLLAATKPAAW